MTEPLSKNGHQGATTSKSGSNCEEIFESLLAALDVTNADDPNGNYNDAMAKAKRDTQVLEKFQELLSERLKEETQNGESNGNTRDSVHWTNFHNS